ncbi:hypothetical protein Q9966_012711 [Columba livia]|nr:hypothetical protein Q9966_012711 [Columba livia]
MAALETTPAAPWDTHPAPPSHWIVGHPHWQRGVLAGSRGRDPPTSVAPSVQSSHPPQAGAAAPQLCPRASAEGSARRDPKHIRPLLWAAAAPRPVPGPGSGSRSDTGLSVRPGGPVQGGPFLMASAIYIYLFFLVLFFFLLSFTTTSGYLSSAVSAVPAAGAPLALRVLCGCRWLLSRVSLGAVGDFFSSPFFGLNFVFNCCLKV